MKTHLTLPPGHPDAIKMGCLCDPEVNEKGKGIKGLGIDWYSRPDCPVHGKPKKERNDTS